MSGGNLTRILNNQIYAGTIIASQKIAAGTITGSLFASNITIPGDVLISGNLFVTGNSVQTTIASTNTYVNDPLITLNNGFSGTNTYDEGLIFNRGTATNAGFIWSEAFQEFRIVYTTETGTTYGNVNATRLANLSVGNLFNTGTAIVGTLNATTVTVTGNIIGGLASFASINNTPIGNATASSGAFTSLVSTGTHYANATTSSNTATNGALVVAGAVGISGNLILSATSNLIVGGSAGTNGQYLVATGTGVGWTTPSAGSAIVSGGSNVTVTANYVNVAVNGTNVASFSTQGIINTAIGAAGASTGAFTTLTATGNLIVGLAQAAALNATPIGNATASTGAFTTLTATGNVIGGLGQFAALNSTPIGNSSPSTGVFTTATAGAVNAPFIGNTGTVFTGASINTSGNVDAATVLAQLVTSDDATFGNVAAGFIGNTATIFTGATAQFTGNVIGGIAQFASINATPIGNATPSTGVFTTATAGAVNAPFIGNTGAVVQGAIAQFTGNVIGGLASFAAINATPIGNATASTASVTTFGASGIATFTNSTNSTSAADGAVIIQGGASVAKDLWVGGNLYAANIIGVSANVITVQDPLLYLRPATVFPYNYDIGIYSAFTGSGLSTLANVYQHTAVFRDPLTNTWTFASNLAEPSASYITLDGNTVYDPIKAGNLTLVNGIAATNFTSGALQVLGGTGITGALYVGSGIQNTVIGNTTAAAGTFTTVTAGAVNSGFIGNTGTAFTGASINLSGNVSASQLIAATLSTRSAYGNIHLTQFASIFAQGNNSENQSIIQLSTTGLSDGMGMWGFTGSDGRLFSTKGINFATGVTVRDQDTPTGGVGLVTITAAGDLWANATTPASNTTTGAFVVKGGVGIGGNLYAGAGIQNTAIGNTTAASGAFTSLSATGTIYANATTSSNTATSGALVVAGALGLSGNLILSGSSNIIAAGTAGTAGQYLVATGTGVQWQTLSVAAGAYIVSGGSNVTVTQNYANISINSGNVAIFRAEGISAAIGAYSANTAQFTTLSASQNVTFNNYTGYLKAAGGSPLSASGTIPNTDITGLGSMSTQNSTSVSITGGSIDNTPIGVSTASTGKFTTLEATQTGLFNSAQGTNTFTIKGVSDAALFLAIPNATGGLDGVVISGAGNTTPSLGVAAKFGGTGGIQVPYGTTAQRPGSNGNVDLVGMVRYNTTINNLEFCTTSGTPGTWSVAGSNVTVISDRQYSGNVGGSYGNVDGTNTSFVIQSASTTAGTIVSINGIMQFPTLAYSVSGTTLTFTEPPAPGDVIDVRVLTTTTSVTTLASTSGYNQFIVDGTGSSIWTGTSSSVEQVLVDPVGNFNLLNKNHITYTQANVNIPATSTAYSIDSFAQTTYSTAKYTVQSRVGTTRYESYEALVGTNGQGTANIVVVSSVSIGGAGLGTLTANVVAGNVNLYYSSTVAQANVKAFGTYIV
jgi:hypothetical protein